MKRHLYLLPGPHSYVIIMGITMCVIVIGVGAWSSTSYLQTKDETGLKGRSIPTGQINIRNATRGLSVVSLGKADELSGADEIIQLVLRNDYDKPITSYIVSRGITETQKEFLVNEDIHTLPPGESVKQYFAFDSELQKHGIVVLAVLFDDGAGDGSPAHLKKLLEYRKGMKIQRKHTIKALQNLAHAKNLDLHAALESVTADIAALPEEEMKQLPLYVQFGIKDEQKRLIQVIHTFFQKVDALTTLNQAGEQADVETRYRKELSLLVAGYKKTLKVL